MSVAQAGVGAQNNTDNDAGGGDDGGDDDDDKYAEDDDESGCAVYLTLWLGPRPPVSFMPGTLTWL